MKGDYITLEGILMYRDVELAEFKIVDDTPRKFEVLTDRLELFPYEMINERSGWTLIDALKEKVVPRTRQRIEEELRKIGINGYDISKILDYQNASTFGDDNWVKFKGRGPQTWGELKARIGYID